MALSTATTLHYHARQIWHLRNRSAEESQRERHTHLTHRLRSTTSFHIGLNIFIGRLCVLRSPTTAMKQFRLPTRLRARKRVNIALEQRRTTLAFLKTFTHLDLEKNLALQTFKCQHDHGPHVMWPARKMNRKQYAYYVRELKDIFVDMHMEVKKIIQTKRDTHVTVRAIAHTTSSQ